MTREARHQREMACWQRQLRRPKTNLYPVYLVLIISLIYMVDEVASQIGMLMKTEIATDLFARLGDSSVGALEILAAIGMSFRSRALPIALWRCTGDTRGIDLNTVTGTEWD